MNNNNKIGSRVSARAQLLRGLTSLLLVAPAVVSARDTTAADAPHEIESTAAVIDRRCQRPHEAPRFDDCHWTFHDATHESGLDYSHGFATNQISESDLISGGVAAGDYDADGDIDLYVVTGDIGPNLLYRNHGDGSFEEVGAEAGVALDGHRSSGPIFADVDGDGHLDLLVAGTSTVSLTVLFINNGDGSFEEVSATHLPVTKPALNAAFADIDRDGDLDLVLAHWGVSSYGGPGQPLETEILWRNNGAGVFEDWSGPGGLTDSFPVLPVSGDTVRILDLTFTPNFADLDDDGWPDLVLASDFGTSKVLMNEAGIFHNATTPVISDENGMGGTVGDFDNDGDMDWFVSSIYDRDQMNQPGQNWGLSGNRLYRNDGQGNFSDATDEAGVRRGYWGWASCFADFNNDSRLDLLHVNGFPLIGTEFDTDPTRLFMNQGSGVFAQRALRHGLNDRAQGRGVVCFDADRDGDLDLFIANNQAPGRYFRNDGVHHGNYFTVQLAGPPGNTQGIGAKVWLQTNAATLRRDIRAGSNFVSQDPAEAHFGLGAQKYIDQLRVEWPDGEEAVILNLRANSRIQLRHPALGAPALRYLNP